MIFGYIPLLSDTHAMRCAIEIKYKGGNWKDWRRSASYMTCIPTGTFDIVVGIFYQM
jgi:hypothetical protein